MHGELSRRRVVLASVLARCPPLAQPQPPTEEKQQASELVKQAIAKSQAGDHEAAIDLYLKAYTIIPQPLLLSNIGSEYQQIEQAGRGTEVLLQVPRGRSDGHQRRLRDRAGQDALHRARRRHRRRGRGRLQAAREARAGRRTARPPHRADAAATTAARARGRSRRSRPEDSSRDALRRRSASASLGAACSASASTTASRPRRSATRSRITR